MVKEVFVKKWGMSVFNYYGNKDCRDVNYNSYDFGCGILNIVEE